MHPGSDTPLAAALAEFDREAAALDGELAANRAYLAGRAAAGPDPQIVRSLEDAARSPRAPESLRRLAARVARGELSWADVLSGSCEDRQVIEFRREAFEVARAVVATEPEAGEQPVKGPTRPTRTSPATP